jgi:LacI family transcriptional regulator
MAKTSQKQLARLLNLSLTTISRSLSNHPVIHPETRARVQALAMKLGYDKTPTRIIRRSRKSNPLSIGVLVGMPAINYGMATYPAVLQGIRSRAATDHVEVTVINQDPTGLELHTLRQPVFQQIRSYNWRGLILIYPFAPDVVDQISKKISTVSALTEYDHLAIDTVDTDHSDIIGVIGRLASLGHRRVGFVNWHYAVGGRWASRRFAAYAEGIFQHALTFDTAWTLNIHQHLPLLSTPDAVADYVAKQTRDAGVTAWVCAADHQAYQLIADLRLRNIEVPRDCSISGFDGIVPPPGMPQLTTLSVNHADIGGSALSRLLNRILHPNSPRRKILVETNLVEGSSIAPPPRQPS